MKKLYLIVLVFLIPIFSHSTNPISPEAFEELKVEKEHYSLFSKIKMKVVSYSKAIFQKNDKVPGEKYAGFALLFGFLSLGSMLIPLMIMAGLGTTAGWGVFVFILPSIFSSLGLFMGVKSALLLKNYDKIDKVTKSKLRIGIVLSLICIAPTAFLVLGQLRSFFYNLLI